MNECGRQIWKRKAESDLEWNPSETEWQQFVQDVKTDQLVEFVISWRA